jgi:hypothetical protein
MDFKEKYEKEKRFKPVARLSSLYLISLAGSSPVGTGGEGQVQLKVILAT